MNSHTIRAIGAFTAALIGLHLGPGPHPDGSPQSVHGGGQMTFDFAAKPERRKIEGRASGGRKRTVAGRKIDTAEVVNQAIDESNAAELDLARAEDALRRLGHSNPPPELVARYAIEDDMLSRLGRITSSNAGGQIGKWDFTNAETIHRDFNAYLERRIGGQHARWTERTRGY